VVGEFMHQRSPSWSRGTSVHTRKRARLYPKTDLRGAPRGPGAPRAPLRPRRRGGRREWAQCARRTASAGLLHSPLTRPSAGSVGAPSSSTRGSRARTCHALVRGGRDPVAGSSPPAARRRERCRRALPADSPWCARVNPLPPGAHTSRFLTRCISPNHLVVSLSRSHDAGRIRLCSWPFARSGAHGRALLF
jgi:hypothetical protein